MSKEYWMGGKKEWEELVEGLSDAARRTVSNYLAHSMLVLKKTEDGIYFHRSDYDAGKSGIRSLEGIPCYLYLTNNNSRFYANTDLTIIMESTW